MMLERRRPLFDDDGADIGVSRDTAESPAEASSTSLAVLPVVEGRSTSPGMDVADSTVFSTFEDPLDVCVF